MKFLMIAIADEAMQQPRYVEPSKPTVEGEAAKVQPYFIMAKVEDAVLAQPNNYMQILINMSKRLAHDTQLFAEAQPPKPKLYVPPVRIPKDLTVK